MKKIFIILTVTVTLCLLLGKLDNADFSVVAQTNKTNMQTSNNLSTTTNTTKPSSSIQDTFSESGTINSLIYLSSGDNNSTLGGAKNLFSLAIGS